MDDDATDLVNHFHGMGHQALVALPASHRLGMVRTLTGECTDPRLQEKARNTALKLLLTNSYDSNMERHENTLLHELRYRLHWDLYLRQIRERWDDITWTEFFTALNCVRAYCAQVFNADPGGPLGYFSLSREECRATGRSRYPLIVAFPKTVDDAEARLYPGLNVREPFSMAVNTHRNAGAIHRRYPAFEAFIVHEQTHLNDFFRAEQIRSGQMDESHPFYPVANSIRLETDFEFYKKDKMGWAFARASMTERHAQALEHKMAALWRQEAMPWEEDIVRYDFKHNDAQWPLPALNVNLKETGGIVRTLSSFWPKISRTFF